MPKRRGAGQGGTAEAAPAAKRSSSHGPGLTASVENVQYRIEGGLRHVEPYDFDFTTFVKQRWLGRSLLEVFTKEFIAYSAEYYRAAIEAGRVTVNGKQVSPDYILKNSERIVHTAVSCRENPVLDRGIIQVVADNEQLLVVSKPSSLPIHPCGSYRYNCLIALLRAQGVAAPDAELHTTHRLDRLTSGLVILAKTKEAARQLGAWFSAGEVRKTYLARVRGGFGQLLERSAAELLAGSDSADNASSVKLPAGVSRVGPGRLRLEGYVHCLDHKVGKYAFAVQRPEVPAGGEEPKDSATEFELVGEAPGGESVVKCFPFTGRTHQIRVHLRHLGFPIANDSCYGGELRDDPSLPLIPHVYQASEVTVAAAKGTEVPEGSAEAQTIMHSSGIFLHALTYAVPGATYSSEPPTWAECGRPDAD